MISQGPPPPIAFSRGGKIFVMTDQGKLSGQPIATSGASDEEPAWNRTGDLIAYVQRNPADNTSSIWVVNPAKPQTARQLTGDGFVDKRPSVSPNGRVIAFVRASAKTPTDFRLCFKRISSTGRIPVCVRTPALSVARPSWAPDGHAISVILQSDPKDANQTEVALFTSATPNSAVPANWNYRGPITDDMHSHTAAEGALYASWSPDGTTLAVSANWGTPFFHLELLTMSNDLPKPGARPVAVPRVHSCDISWRPDGLVLVVQQSDTCDGSVSSIMRVVLATRDLHPLQSGLTPAWSPAVAKP